MAWKINLASKDGGGRRSRTRGRLPLKLNRDDAAEMGVGGGQVTHLSFNGNPRASSGTAAGD